MIEVRLPSSLWKHFSEYGPVAYDGGCGKCIGWGYTPLKHLGEKIWNEADKYGDWICFRVGNWSLITRWLTPQEAIQLCGKITDIESGPQGGFKSVTYGKQKFVSSNLSPPNELVKAFWANTKVEWVVEVRINPKEHSSHNSTLVSELRDEETQYATWANVYERMLGDGWIGNEIFPDGQFTRVEKKKDGYLRKQLTSLLNGLDVRISPIRQTRKAVL